MEPKCIKCNKPATANIQKLWVKWEYDEVMGYSPEHELIPDIDPDEGENLHFCTECVNLWEQGEI